MGLSISVDEQKEIAERTNHDPAVIMSFYEWYGRYKKLHHDDVTACRLALAKQAEVYQATFPQKLAEYLAAIAQDYRTRLLVKKKWQSGQVFKTKSGIRVRSKIEKIIADFLFEQGIHFVYEPIANLGGFYLMPDFYLSDFEVVIEHFGMEDQKYQQSAQRKLGRYRQFKIRVVCTYPSDEPDIEEVLARKLREVGVPIENRADAAVSTESSHTTRILS